MECVKMFKQSTPKTALGQCIITFLTLKYAHMLLLL